MTVAAAVVWTVALLQLARTFARMLDDLLEEHWLETGDIG